MRTEGLEQEVTSHEETPESLHDCGFDFDPYCDGCVTMRGDAGF